MTRDVRANTARARKENGDFGLTGRRTGNEGEMAKEREGAELLTASADNTWLL